MKPRHPWRLFPMAAVLFCAVDSLGFWPAPAGARTPDAEPLVSLSGSYLAGRIARSQHDAAGAAAFYREALARDPGSEILLEQAFLMEATQGDWPRAQPLAEELAARQDQNRMARAFLGLAAFKAADFAKAEEHFSAGAASPVGELTNMLARAWVKLAAGDAKGALDLLDVQKQPDWAREYVRYHRAILADAAGRAAEARAAFEQVFRHDPRSLRSALGYARRAARDGDFKLARTILRTHSERAQGDPQPLVRALEEQLQAGARIGPLVPNATEGLAEVFYGLGEALSGEGGVSLGEIYLQFALYLSPENTFALLALAQTHETARQFADANEVYDRVLKPSVLDSGIAIQKAYNLSYQDRVDEAQTLLEQEAAKAPGDTRALDALGNIMRTRKRFAEASRYYTQAIALIPKPDQRHWPFFYFRGTCYERLKDWPSAESDLVRALKLFPDQPNVLNYLGYSWIDQNKNLKQGLAYIEKAVALKPDDGYIVDSLGWAHYKLGNFKDAAQYLEHAVELRPEDPVLNDHLGDALWRVGREREARFQWDQALILKPEPEEVEKIKRKLAEGLVPPEKPPVPKRAKQAKRGDAAKRRESKLDPPRPILE